MRQGRVGSVMAAYNRVDGEACAASPTLLGRTLRGRWGFSGYVVGDCGAVEDIFANHHLVPTPEAAAASALRAGTDLDCGRGYAALGRALARGLCAESDLDRALVRLFAARFRLGLFDPPELVPWTRLPPSAIESPEHLALAREAAARAVVLLENRGGVLPLPPALRALAVVGPTADDVPVLLANYHGTPSRPVTLLDGIRAAARARDVSVAYARGGRLTETSSGDLADAAAVARDSDAVIAVVGLDPRLEGEENDARLNRAGDRVDLGLPASQERLLEVVAATGKPVIVVLTGGSALATPWAAAHAAAILYAWYPGAEGGNAVADVLFGEVSPAGRLPITIYRSVDDLPPFSDYAMAGRTYRYLDRAPLYRSVTACRTRRSAIRTWRSRPTPFAAARSPSTSRTPDAGPATRWSRRTSCRAARRPTRPAAGSPRSRGFRSPPGERRTVRLALPPEALSLVDEQGRRRPLTGDLDIAVGGGQPNRAGRYPDDARGATISVHLADTPPPG